MLIISFLSIVFSSSLLRSFALEAPSIVKLNPKPNSLIDTKPHINDLHLKVQDVVRGLQLPTTMAFVGPNDFLVLEKNKGIVQRIVNGKMLSHPLLNANASNGEGRGMLGIAVMQYNGHIFVFLSYLQSAAGKT